LFLAIDWEATSLLVGTYTFPATECHCSLAKTEVWMVTWW